MKGKKKDEINLRKKAFSKIKGEIKVLKITFDNSKPRPGFQ